MIKNMELFLITLTAIASWHYLNALLFVIFKAKKYEDCLAKKISQEVKKALEENDK